MSDIIKAGVLPVAIEFMDRPCIEATEAFAKAGYPMCEALLIVEVEGSDAEIDEQLGVIMQIARRHNPVELREAQSEDEAKRIWLGRKSAFGAMGQINDYMCLDGTIPVSALPEVLRRIAEMSDEYGLKVANVFHAGDGNMHPLILFDANKPGDLELCEAFGADILKLCVEVGGCLTGEHGVGIEKRDLMTTQFEPQDLEIQMKVKDVFDPGWLLNPAKVFSAGRLRGAAQAPFSPSDGADPCEGASPLALPRALFFGKMKERGPVLTPTSEAELSEAIASADGPLRILGGGTRPIGRPVTGASPVAGRAERCRVVRTRRPDDRREGGDPARGGRGVAGEGKSAPALRADGSPHTSGNRG